ncbi:Cell cycle serine/threonine-protein kinase cdc5/MSD2 [Friedmanniomyces endolithicus]|nr:Cell cycle serine/threonine-protein kinase cdc5/MSD2 [Friedmanniomyces endolithicus]
MCSALDGDELDGSRNDGNFVRFYQRIGSVGIWAFADGSLQVQFPDHTKLVLSASGTHISATCISPEAAAYLASRADLLPNHISSREIFDDSVQALLHEGGRIRARVIKANALAAKLGFVLRVVEQWTRNQGLGRLDEGDDGLEWDGFMLREGARKADRVTVGRFGGDDGARMGQ